MEDLFCNALVHVIYLGVSGQYFSYNKRIEMTIPFLVSCSREFKKERVGLQHALPNLGKHC